MKNDEFLNYTDLYITKNTFLYDNTARNSKNRSEGKIEIFVNQVPKTFLNCLRTYAIAKTLQRDECINLVWSGFHVFTLKC